MNNLTMQLPLSWLKKFVNLKASAEEIAERLTLSGSEVARIIRRGQGLEKVVVGQIKRIKPHPSAEKLRLAYVDVGKQELEIVCGAPNIATGQKVPVALPGGRVAGQKIEKKEIRGVKSEGMLASEHELGLSDNHEGVMVLPALAKIGDDAIALLELSDPIFEFELTPNRPDCFSVLGISRELAAIFKLHLTIDKLHLTESAAPASKFIKVEVKDKNFCPLYAARVIRGAQIKSSPLWLQNKLRQTGVRPINNVVDVTNFVMLETGQPLHAFDLAKLAGGKIIARQARRGEKIAALDGQTYDLNPDTLVIADSDKPAAIAGVMGGQESGVDSETKDIVLESALFDPVSVRRTSRALGLRSESSLRFERGLDYQMTESASKQAASLLVKLAGGQIARGAVAVSGRAPAVKIINFNPSAVEKTIGVPLSPVRQKKILSGLGFKIKSPGRGQGVVLQVPSWREHDIKEQADIAEEIGRMLDYNTLPKTLPATGGAAPELTSSYKLRRKLRQLALGWGASEIFTYSFYGEDLLPFSGKPPAEHFKLVNPVNKEYPYLRYSLLPWMLSALSKNSALLPRGRFRLFEIGRVFKPAGEEWQAAIGFIDVKASSELLFRRLLGFAREFFGLEPAVEKRQANIFDLKLNNEKVAKIVIADKNSAAGLRWRSLAAVLLIYLSPLEKQPAPVQKSFTPLPYYPSVERDIALVLPGGAAYKDIWQFVEKFSPLLKRVELFDVYHGLQGGTSVALQLEFCSTDRTLTSGEVDEAMKDLRKKLEKRGVVIR